MTQEQVYDWEMYIDESNSGWSHSLFSVPKSVREFATYTNLIKAEASKHDLSTEPSYVRLLELWEQFAEVPSGSYRNELTQYISEMIKRYWNERSESKAPLLPLLIMLKARVAKNYESWHLTQDQSFRARDDYLSKKIDAAKLTYDEARSKLAIKLEDKLNLLATLTGFANKWSQMWNEWARYPVNSRSGLFLPANPIYENIMRMQDYCLKEKERLERIGRFYEKINKPEQSTPEEKLIASDPFKLKHGSFLLFSYELPKGYKDRVNSPYPQMKKNYNVNAI
ncbi:MAG: hypothetical protein ABI597_11795 [Gammaproteobacteria bacterium]